MNVIKIILAVLIFSSFVWSVFYVNKYSVYKYQYSPFNIKNMAAVFFSLLILLIAQSLIPEGIHMTDILYNMASFNFTMEESDSMVLVFISSVVLVSTFVNLKHKSNFFVAIYAIISMAIFSVIIFLILFALASILGSNKNKRR